MIGRLAQVVVDCTRPRELVHFWAAVLGGEAVERDDEWCYVDPPKRSRLAFQRVPEAKAGKNRVHLDVLVKDMPEALAAVEALGGRRVGELQVDQPGSFHVMQDPEGNEWCLVQPPVPPP